MSVLVDTNILLRVAHAGSPDRALTMSVVVVLRKAGMELCLVPQVIYEYWAVATRPASVNGLGMTATAAEDSLKQLLEGFTLRLDERGIYAHWRTLVTQHDVKGKNAHDARLVAAMNRHGLTHLLTYNTADFQRYAGITVLSPADVLAGRGEVRG